MGADGSVVLVGTILNGLEDDFVAFKLDSEGMVLWQWQVTRDWFDCFFYWFSHFLQRTQIPSLVARQKQAHTKCIIWV